MRSSVLILIALDIFAARLQAQLPVILSQPPNRVVWTGSTVKLGVSTGSIPPTSFRWLFNSTNLPCGLMISTVAGNGTNDYSGDGGPAVNASLNDPRCVLLVSAGNLYIADSSNNRIRKVGTDGNITTVAGNGTNAYLGDGGPATNASLNYPQSVALDGFGNLFIADNLNYVIRKVNTNGIINTVAGNGVSGHTGDGGAATNASLYSPLGLVVDTGGNLFFTEYIDNISFARKVDSNGIITTVAGINSPFNSGYSGDGGPATNASVNFPRGIAVDFSGNLFIADTRNNRIRKVDTNGIITTVAGNGSVTFSGDGGFATNAGLNHPINLTLDNSGNLFIADYSHNCIRRVNTNGIITTVVGGGTAGDGGIGTNAALNGPYSVAVDGIGNLFIADNSNQRIRLVNSPQYPNSIKNLLSLTNVTMASAGNYQMVVTDPNGSATSSVARLAVVTSPQIYQTTISSKTNFMLNFVCQPGSTNLVLCATNLSSPVIWFPISTNIAGADGDWQFTDPNAANYQALFYRSVTQ